VRFPLGTPRFFQMLPFPKVILLTTAFTRNGKCVLAHQEPPTLKGFQWTNPAMLLRGQGRRSSDRDVVGHGFSLSACHRDAVTDVNPPKIKFSLALQRRRMSPSYRVEDKTHVYQGRCSQSDRSETLFHFLALVQPFS
jgi:hypothetical protein